MKKLLFLLLIVGLGNINASGQDTVRLGDPWYLFDSTVYAQPPFPFHFAANPAIVHFMKYDAGSKAQVYGIALPVYIRPENKTGEFPMTVYLAEKEGYGIDTVYPGGEYTSPVEVTTHRFTVLDSATDHQRNCYFTYSLTDDNILDCYEYYFDQPIIVEDSFFVGLRFHDYDDDYVYGYPVSPQVHIRNFFDWSSDSSDYKVMYNGKLDRGDAQMYRSSNYGGAYVILQLRCNEQTEGLHVVSRYGDTVVIEWDSTADEEPFRVIVSRDSVAIDTFFVDSTRFTYVGLDTTAEMSFTVSRACRYTTPGYDTLVWSARGATLLLGVAEPDPEPEPNAIRTAGALSMELVPNPAQERVTVRCAQAEGGTVSVVDMQGRTLLTQAAKATTVLDISTLPDGPYLVRIVTPTATATRKLSVVR